MSVGCYVDIEEKKFFFDFDFERMQPFRTVAHGEALTKSAKKAVQRDYTTKDKMFCKGEEDNLQNII